MRRSNATALVLSPFFTCVYCSFKNRIFNTVLIFLVVLIQFVQAQDNDFFNGDFEYSSTCDPEDCEDLNIPCIDGWTYWANSDPYAFGWYSYPCQVPDLECENLGNRGIWLERDAGNGNFFAVTENPAYNQNPNAVYKIDLDFLPYSSDVPPHVRISGVNSVSSGTLTTLATTQDAFEVCEDFHATFMFDHGTGFTPPPNITSFRYLVFSLVGTFVPSPEPDPNLTLWGVLDNVHMCKVLEVVVQDDCDPVCVSVDFNGSCYSSPCETQECSTNLLVTSGLETFMDVSNSDSWENIIECNGIPENQEEIDVSFQAINEDFPSGLNIRFTYEITDCPADYEVNASTTWDSGNVPNDGKFKTLTVKNGATLTIEEDAVLHFCEEGSLIVEKRGQLELYGTLTSNCSHGWLGVKAYGDQNYNQFEDPNIHAYRQARIFMYPESVIENAITAVELFGPTIEDTGGQIFADEAIFLNNSKGIVFYPYTNYVLFNGVHSKPRPYQSEISGCTFLTNDEYQLQVPFREDILLISVDGVPILGNEFQNDQTLPDATNLLQFGTGIHALGAGFIVDQLDCTSPCEPKQSTFRGFAQAIFSTRVFENKPYIVNRSLFERNYFGIVNSGVSEATLTFNEFNFGSVPNPDVRNDQIGIHLRSDLFSINVQENTFTYDGEALDNAIGIVSEALGTKDLQIRRNFFNGVTVGNEAFGKNANNSSFRQEGLFYLCNFNVSGKEKDFYVPEESIYESNNIRRNQNTITINGTFPINVAAGNTFSTIGNEEDGDLANYGIDQLNYFFNPFGTLEEPLDYIGIVSLVEARPNDCLITACEEPCFYPGDEEQLKQSFFNSQELLNNALDEEDTLLIQYYQNNLDSFLI